MKTKIFNYSGMSAIFAIALSACGGSGGDGSIDRGPILNTGYLGVNIISPSANAVDVCPNFTLQLTINGVENCGVDFSNTVQVYRPGNDPTTSAVKFSSFDPKPLPAENKCLLSGQVQQALVLGNKYRVRVAQNVVNGMYTMADYMDFTTITQSALTANPSLCQDGSFDVNTINGGRDFQKTNLLDFGTINDDLTVDFSPEALNLFASSIGNIILSEFTKGFLGLGTALRYDSSPDARHAYRATFTQDVDDNSAVNMQVYKVTAFDPGTSNTVFTLVPDVRIERHSASEYWIRPWSSVTNSDQGWEGNRTYVIIIKKALASTHALNMPQSVLKIFTTAKF